MLVAFILSKKKNEAHTHHYIETTVCWTAQVGFFVCFFCLLSCHAITKYNQRLWLKCWSIPIILLISVLLPLSVEVYCQAEHKTKRITFCVLKKLHSFICIFVWLNANKSCKMPLMVLQIAFMFKSFKQHMFEHGLWRNTYDSQYTITIATTTWRVNGASTHCTVFVWQNFASVWFDGSVASNIMTIEWLIYEWMGGRQGIYKSWGIRSGRQRAWKSCTFAQSPKLHRGEGLTPSSAVWCARLM